MTREIGDLCAALPGGMSSEDDIAAELAATEDATFASVLAQLEDPMDVDDDEAIDWDDRVPTRLEPQATEVEAWKRSGWILLVPTGDPTDIPVRLGWYGGCNYDVTPVIYTAVLREWSDRYGVELVALDESQTMELLVTRPPTDPRECHAVAHEQFRYCPDIIEQGFESIHDLAAKQVPARTWFLWWD